METDKTALVVVDMQNSFASEEGKLFSEKSRDIIPDIAELIDEFGKDGLVVYTQDTHTDEQFNQMDNYDEFERWGEHCIEGSWGHKIVDELRGKEDYKVQKNTYDAFHNTNLDSILEDENIENVVIVGTLANVCVLHTASSAALNDYQTLVVEDLVGYIEEEDKEYALHHADWLFGQTVKSEEL